MSSTGRLKRRLVPWMAGMLAAAVVACGDDGTGPGSGAGRIRAVAHDDPSGRAGALAPVASYSVASAEESSFSGSMTGSMNVAIAAEGGAWVELGPPRQVTVRLQSTQDTAQVHGEAEVPAGTYSRVRIVMQEARANLLAGSVVGGITLSGALSITIGGGSEVVIEKRVSPFRVTADASTEIVTDFNSEAWMTAQTTESRTVSKSEVESAMTVTARSVAKANN